MTNVGGFYTVCHKTCHFGRLSHCLSVIVVSPTKTAEPTEMAFGRPKEACIGWGHTGTTWRIP